jgi:hypothetical protein
MTDIIAHLSFSAELTDVAVLLSVAAIVCGGWAFHSAIYSVELPSWVRADSAIIAVALYAFAFGRLHTIDAQSAAQILAYSVGFLFATLLQPLSDRFNTTENSEQGE